MTPYPMKKEPMQIFAREMAVKDQEIAALQAKLEAAESESARWEDGCRDYKSRLEAAERVVEAKNDVLRGWAALFYGEWYCPSCRCFMDHSDECELKIHHEKTIIALAAKTELKPQPQEPSR